MADLRELVEAARPFADELRSRSCEPHYGYPVVENPHDFDPDRECCTPEEIANHKAACEAWDRGERNVRPTTCGNLASNGWGIGAQTIHDPAMKAAADLLDHLLTHPEAVEAVEVLRAWGEARKGVCDAPPCIDDPGSCEHCFLFSKAWDAMKDAAKLADRLAAKGGE